MKTKKEKPLHVGAFIRADDKFLVVLRKRDVYAGMLGLPGGHVEEGEGYDQALKRELMEETGYTVEIVDDKPVITSEVTTESFSIQLDIYRAEIVGEKQESDDEKVGEVLWVDADKFIESLENYSFPENATDKFRIFLRKEDLFE